MTRRISFDPSKDIPSLNGKNVLITGGYSGLGKQSALDLAKHSPEQIWIAGRSAAKAEPALSAIRQIAPAVSVKFLELDLASLASVVKAADTLSSAIPRLDIVMLNAGVLNLPPGVTVDGYETHFGINHIGHAMLIKRLEPLLRHTSSIPGASVRVVVVSSNGHKHSVPEGIRFNTLKTSGNNLSAIARYGQSKLANVLFAKELARRHPQWIVASVHPGDVKTELHHKGGDSMAVRLFQKLAMPLIGVSVEDGVRSQLWAATSESVTSGEYYEPVGVGGKGGCLVEDVALRERLWEWTEKEFEAYSG